MSPLRLTPIFRAEIARPGGGLASQEFGLELRRRQGTFKEVNGAVFLETLGLDDGG